MKHSELNSRVAEIRAAFEAHASTAPTYADPSWFAHRGYVSAAGNSGAGHLAWERIAPELLRLRSTYTRLGRSFRDHELAFVMAYGLGLTDQGALSHADADELADAIMPATRKSQPLYRAPVFWMMTMLVVLLDISVAVAISIGTPEYPTLSAPLDVAAGTDGEPTSEIKPEESQTTNAQVTDIATKRVQALLDGVGNFDAAIVALSRSPEPIRTQLAHQLFSGLHGSDKESLVKWLSDLPGVEISALIRRAFHSYDVRVVLAAISASVSRGDRLAHIGLSSLLDHADATVRLRSLEALSIVGTANDAHAILPCLTDDSTAVVARASLKAILGVDRGTRTRSWRRYLHRRAARARR